MNSLTSRALEKGSRSKIFSMFQLKVGSFFMQWSADSFCFICPFFTACWVFLRSLFQYAFCFAYARCLAVVAVPFVYNVLLS